MSKDVRCYSHDDKNIAISGLPPVSYCLYLLVGISAIIIIIIVIIQWLPIHHPGDSGGRGTSGDAGQVR